MGVITIVTVDGLISQLITYNSYIPYYNCGITTINQPCLGYNYYSHSTKLHWVATRWAFAAKSQHREKNTDGWAAPQGPHGPHGERIENGGLKKLFKMGYPRGIMEKLSYFWWLDINISQYVGNHGDSGYISNLGSKTNNIETSPVKSIGILPVKYGAFPCVNGISQQQNMCHDWVPWSSWNHKGMTVGLQRPLDDAKMSMTIFLWMINWMILDICIHIYMYIYIYYIGLCGMLIAVTVNISIQSCKTTRQNLLPMISAVR